MPMTTKDRLAVSTFLAEADWEQLAKRFVFDELQKAIPAVWERRARVFEDAAPRHGDFTGRATEEELAEATRRCQETALACRRHAELLRGSVVQIPELGRCQAAA